MTEDRKGFAVDVGELDQIANSTLPEVVDALRAPIKVITAREGIDGPRSLPALAAMEAEYAGFTGGIGYRQQVGCARIEATAQALREIVALYRRVDGQG